MKSIMIKSASVLGIEGFGIDVEVSLEEGFGIKILGIPDTSAKECGVRVRAAILHGGFALPLGKVVVNIAPANVVMDCASLDLPIAVALLALAEHVPAEPTNGYVFCGEMGLDGSLRRIRGALPMALHVRTVGARGFILPDESAGETDLARGVNVRAMYSLSDVVECLRGHRNARPAPAVRQAPAPVAGPDLSEVRGLETAKRALEVAASGGHNLLFIGPPGSGKALIARCMVGILPPMNEGEAVETAAIYSAAGKLEGVSGLTSRPFRAPHHDCSVAGLVGGGSVPRPGEVTLAHNGVLFLDELPEFRSASLEALRQPLEDERVTIIRSRAALTYPAKFLLVGAMNPCPCGYLGSSVRACACSESVVKRYRARVDVNNFDLVVEVAPVDYKQIRAGREDESSAAVRDRVIVAREVQKKALAGSGRKVNAEMGPKVIRERCAIPANVDANLDAAVRRFGLSGRAVHRILRVARTVADLAGRDQIAASDMAEAVAFRFPGEE